MQNETTETVEKYPFQDYCEALYKQMQDKKIEEELSSLKDKVKETGEHIFAHIDRNKKRYIIGAVVVGVFGYLFKGTPDNIIVIVTQGEKPTVPELPDNILDALPE